MSEHEDKYKHCDAVVYAYGKGWWNEGSAPDQTVSPLFTFPWDTVVQETDPAGYQRMVPHQEKTLDLEITFSWGFTPLASVLRLHPMLYPHLQKPIRVPVMSFRNGKTWKVWLNGRHIVVNDVILTHDDLKNLFTDIVDTFGDGHFLTMLHQEILFREHQESRKSPFTEDDANTLERLLHKLHGYKPLRDEFCECLRELTVKVRASL
jgi:hypothetical protein